MTRTSTYFKSVSLRDYHRLVADAARPVLDRAEGLRRKPAEILQCGGILWDPRRRFRLTGDIELVAYAIEEHSRGVYHHLDLVFKPGVKIPRSAIMTIMVVVCRGKLYGLEPKAEFTHVDNGLLHQYLIPYNQEQRN